MKSLPKYAVLENTLEQNKKSYYFYNPSHETIALKKNEIKRCFSYIQKMQENNLYVVGFVSYEAGYYINHGLQHLMSCEDSRPLMHFVAFKNLTEKIPDEFKEESNTSYNKRKIIEVLYSKVGLKKYKDKFLDVIKELKYGNSYQVNITKQVLIETSKSSKQLYKNLKYHQKVGYSAYLPFAPNTILSFSPELFFKKEQEIIITNPMKGTANRCLDKIKDLQALNFLKNDNKNRAENLIIVDLLRNDLASMCDTGSISVTESFNVEKYKTLYQMTSKIQGTAKKDITFFKILQHLFPSGSITGAPKKRTMEIIKNIEDSNRGVYTGIIGYIMPNNDMCFNVAIRTLEVFKDKINIGVGGGITIKSQPMDEYKEMETKISFIKNAYQPHFTIIESVYFCKKFRSLRLHLNRMKKSACSFHFEFNISNIIIQIRKYCLDNLEFKYEYKIRMILQYGNVLNIEHVVINTFLRNKIKLKICPYRIDSNNPFWQHKTTMPSIRGFYQKMHEQYVGKDKNVELLFVNNKGYITETRFCNIIVVINNTHYTPKETDGILPGIQRKKLLLENNIKELSINIDMLNKAKKIFLINDIYEKIDANLLK